MAMRIANKQIRAVLSDIDGTLFRSGREELNLYYVKIARFIASGNKGLGPFFGYNTGREIQDVQEKTALITNSNFLSVVENGAFLFNEATQQIITHPLLTKASKEVFKKIRLLVGRPEVTNRLLDCGLQTYLKKISNLAFEPVSPRIDLDSCIDEVSDILCDFLDYIDISNSSIAIDIMPKGISKGTGLMEVCKRTNIPPVQFLIIGDSRNDFPAMGIAGFIGCPSNAQYDCKRFVRARGGYISPFPYVRGVVDIIEHFLSQAN